MNTENTVNELQQLKLNGMLQTYQKVLSTPQQQQPGIHHLMAQLTESEIQSRIHRRTEMYLKLSKLRYDAVLEQVHCTSDRNLNKESIAAISDCGFVKRAENILITGATGCGKSYLACAIGRQACAFGYKTLYFSMSKFLEKITLCKLEGTLLKFLAQIEKISLLILDDFGLQPLDVTSRLALLQIIEDRYGKKSMIITSQLPVGNWYEYIGESTIADAIMDRLSANAHRFDLKGESLRKKYIEN
ncbi:MAG: IS21-like element helper ATPase IstB [Thiomicrorhabdus sp.]|jgi:DNA replication protein DnaC|nr:IS21-like element helper ATPase IstB [Thiomicrorhabdus sp.]